MTTGWISKAHHCLAGSAKDNSYRSQSGGKRRFRSRPCRDYEILSRQASHTNGCYQLENRSYLPIDKLDKIPCNVQWAVAIYPAYVLTDGINGGIRTEK